MKRALLAATAVLSTTFTPLATPAFAGPPIPPEPTALDLYCAANAPQALPNDFWYWDGQLGSQIGTSDGAIATVLGYSMNPASRTIHAIVEFELDSVTYNLQCNAMEPGAIRGEAPPNPNFSYTTTYTDESGGDGTEIGRPAVCNPGKTKLTSNTWYEIPGTSDYREGKTCVQIQNGYLIPWSSIPTL
jgi:hypothetical protein